MKNLKHLSHEQLWAIDRQWLRADALHISFHKEELKKKKKSINSLEYFISWEGTYLCVWYSLLFSVLEGLEQHGFDLSMFKNYDQQLKKDLKNFRNAIFHTPSKYWDTRFVKFIKKYPANLESTVEKLHKEIALALQSEIKHRDKTPDPKMREMVARHNDWSS